MLLNTCSFLIAAWGARAIVTSGTLLGVVSLNATHQVSDMPHSSASSIPLHFSPKQFETHSSNLLLLAYHLGLAWIYPILTHEHVFWFFLDKWFESRMIIFSKEFCLSQKQHQLSSFCSIFAKPLWIPVERDADCSFLPSDWLSKLHFLPGVHQPSRFRL